MTTSFATTIFYCVVCCVAYTTSNVAQTYWLVTGTGISLYGQFIFFLCSLVILSFSILAIHALREKDNFILLPDHRVEERRFFFCTLCRYRNDNSWNDIHEEDVDLVQGELYSPLTSSGLQENKSSDNNTPSSFSFTWNRISQTELLFLMGICNASASILQWYSTPPNREPPLLNSIIPSLAIVFAVPISKYVLGDRKKYLAIAPIGAFVSIFLGLVVGLVPAAMAGGTGSLGGSESVQDIFLWTLVNVFSQLPSAGSLIFAQAFLMRAEKGGEKIGKKMKATAVLRYVAYNQLGVAAGVLFLWFLDIVPWFGSGEAPVSMAEEIRFAFSCSILGAQAGEGCSSLVPLWAALGVLPYAAYLSSVAALSAESAVFGNIVLVAQAALQSLFFLIPNTNPDNASTPVWSALVSVALTLLGVGVYKHWEMLQDKDKEQDAFPLVKDFREDILEDDEVR